LDWTRTDLTYAVPDGSKALRFDAIAFAAFDVYVLKRPGAEKDYSADRLKKAKAYVETVSPHEIDQLTRNILAGLPGSEEGYTLEKFRLHWMSINTLMMLRCVVTFTNL
jgi:mannonate dehydratase